MTESANKEMAPINEKAPKTEKKAPKKANSKFKSWYKGLKSEFSKIIWTDKNTLVKQTVAVVSITAVAGIIITVLDSIALQLINLLIK